jgi:hypothetical protein
VFHRFVDFSSSRRNESGSPSGVLGVVVTAAQGWCRKFPAAPV